MDDKELFQKILEELIGIRKELKRIADYLEVMAEKSKVETMFKWGMRIEPIERDED